MDRYPIDENRTLENMAKFERPRNGEDERVEGDD